MAPPSRSSSRATGVNKVKAPIRKSRTTRANRDTTDSWQLAAREEDDIEQHSDDQQTQHNQTAHHYNGNLDVQSRDFVDLDTIDDAMNPLREMAERVGKEVETFAVNLDKFLEDLPVSANTFDMVLALVEEFKNIAVDAKQAAEKQMKNGALEEQLRREWAEQANLSTQQPAGGASIFGSAGGSKLASRASEKTTKQVETQRHWQQEADLWDLFKLVLELHHNPDEAKVRREKKEWLRQLGDVHRYTPEQTIWSRFLVEDDVARERAFVKDWLEKTANHQQTGLSDVVQVLEEKAGRGQGLWSQGWMHSREKLKGEKRLRPWPNTLNAPLPNIKRTDANELVASSLDPDATSRQGRTLEKQDAYFERATWIACWEMLRRGMPWNEISEWCSQRNEAWRAISIGKAMGPDDVVSASAWRNICYQASQSGGSSDYEAAVYGLLGGNINAVQKVCRTMDDTLYAYYSATLIRQFEQYVSINCPDRAVQSKRGPTEDGLKEPADQITSLILKLRKQNPTTLEAVKPMKIIQSYLLADDLGSFVNTLGYCISFTDSLRGTEEDMIIRLAPFWTGSVNQPEEEVALDQQTLRIAVHIAILMKVLTNEKLSEAELDAEENVIVSYIQALRAAGKRDLIPLYASRLRTPRQVVTMSRVLEDVSSASEQEYMLKLLRRQGLDCMLIINEQLLYLMSQYLAPGLRNPRPLIMLEHTDDTHLYPGQRIIDGFLPDRVSTQDDAILRSVQWFNIIDGYWNETFSALAMAVRKSLVAGRIACALNIIHELPYETVSVRKAYQTIGKSINLMDYDGPAPPNKENEWNMFKEQSRSYYELERVVNAMKALSDWREIEAQFSQTAALRMSSASPELREAKNNVDEAMEKILTGKLLLSSNDPDEAADLGFIRTWYIPELILAYSTVLHTSGTIISRESFIESMDLSVTVADEENRLTECFMESGRMRELVTMFAETSKEMLIMKAKKPWKGRSLREGKDLGIWEIGPQSEGPQSLGRQASF